MRTLRSKVDPRELKESMQRSDEWVRQRYPLDTPYLYTPKGNAIVFIKDVGFRPQEATNEKV